MLAAVRSAPAAPSGAGPSSAGLAGLAPARSLPAGWEHREPGLLAPPDTLYGLLASQRQSEASAKLAAAPSNDPKPGSLDVLFEALKAAGPLRSPSKGLGNAAFAVRGAS